MSLIGAIEAGGTKIVLALARSDGQVLEKCRIDTLHPDKTMPLVAQWFAAVSARNGPIAGFGIASFGPIDIDPTSSKYGSFSTTPKPGWSGASWLAALAQFAVAKAVETDVNGAAMGEWLAGTGRNRATLAYTTVGTGIGTGVVCEGRPLSGLSHYEAGHIRPARPDRDTWPGCCPYHGDCLEGLASGTAISARWGSDLTSLSRAEIGLVAHYLAEFAASLALLHMPDVMIFGGGVMKTPGLIEQLRANTRIKLAGYVSAYDRDLAEIIVLPVLGDDAGITGAIELGRRALRGK